MEHTYVKIDQEWLRTKRKENLAWFRMELAQGFIAVCCFIALAFALFY